MEQQITAGPARMHPLMVGAAASVILVSLIGVAAITGLIPSSHGTTAPVASGYPTSYSSDASSYSSAPVAQAATGTRYVTSDGQVIEILPNSQQVTQLRQARVVETAPAYQPAPVVHRKVVHQYVQNTYSQPARTYQQPAYVPPQHPIQNYVSDMHPVGTGVGAVVGGLLGNQIGGGNGKKIATVAGVLLGGYAGNEVAHNRNPLQN
jgi:uncharacterized protein YcfJ